MAARAGPAVMVSVGAPPVSCRTCTPVGSVTVAEVSPRSSPLLPLHAIARTSAPHPYRQIVRITAGYRRTAGARRADAGAGAGAGAQVSLRGLALYSGLVPFEKSVSLTKIAAAIAGGLIMASFFLPAVDVKAGKSAAREMFGVNVMRAQIEASRNLALVEPLIEPALQSYEVFAETPSLRNLSTICAVTKEILDKTLPLLAPRDPAQKNVPPLGQRLPFREEVQVVTGALWAARLGLWLLPLIGLVTMVVPVVTLRRDDTGVFGYLTLVSRFFFGLVLLLLGVIPLLAVDDAQRPFIGSAVWALLAGSGLMLLTGVAGVNRSNWWYVWLTQVVLLAGLVGFIVMVVQVANS